MDSNDESVYRPRPEGSEMAPGGSPKDGGTMAVQFAHSTTALTRMKI